MFLPVLAGASHVRAALEDARTQEMEDPYDERRQANERAVFLGEVSVWVSDKWTETNIHIIHILVNLCKKRRTCSFSGIIMSLCFIKSTFIDAALFLEGRAGQYWSSLVSRNLLSTLRAFLEKFPGRDGSAKMKKHQGSHISGNKACS